MLVGRGLPSEPAGSPGSGSHKSRASTSVPLISGLHSSHKQQKPSSRGPASTTSPPPSTPFHPLQWATDLAASSQSVRNPGWSHPAVSHMVHALGGPTAFACPADTNGSMFVRTGATKLVCPYLPTLGGHLSGAGPSGGAGTTGRVASA
jgi:hypothetical protein